MRRGDLQRDAGRYREALADYDRILAREPDSLPALLHRGQAHQQAGNLRLAREDYQRALAPEPRSAVIADRLKGCFAMEGGG